MTDSQEELNRMKYDLDEVLDHLEESIAKPNGDPEGTQVWFPT